MIVDPGLNRNSGIIPHEISFAWIGLLETLYHVEEIVIPYVVPNLAPAISQVALPCFLCGAPSRLAIVEYPADGRVIRWLGIEGTAWKLRALHFGGVVLVQCVGLGEALPDRRVVIGFADDGVEGILAAGVVDAVVGHIGEQRLRVLVSTRGKTVCS